MHLLMHSGSQEPGQVRRGRPPLTVSLSEPSRAWESRPSTSIGGDVFQVSDFEFGDLSGVLFKVRHVANTRGHTSDTCAMFVMPCSPMLCVGSRRLWRVRPLRCIVGGGAALAARAFRYHLHWGGGACASGTSGAGAVGGGDHPQGSAQEPLTAQYSRGQSPVRGGDECRGMQWRSARGRRRPSHLPSPRCQARHAAETWPPGVFTGQCLVALRFPQWAHTCRA